MCDHEHYHRLEDRMDRLEDDAIRHHTMVDEQIKTLFQASNRVNASCERLNNSTFRLMWSLIALLGIITVVSVFAVVFGALGDHGFNAVTTAAQGVAR